jgi:hypothetical protein
MTIVHANQKFVANGRLPKLKSIARMRHVRPFVGAGTVFMIVCFAPAMHIARAEPQPAATYQRHAPPPTERANAGGAKNPAKSNTAIGRAQAAPVAQEPPVFLSEEWIKQDQKTEDRLKRIMNICKGC